MTGNLLVKAVGLFSLISVPLLLWCWLMRWIPESTPDYAVVTGLSFFSIVALGCLHKPLKK